MRPAHEWVKEPGGAYADDEAFIRAIQSDASRSAARSERERCIAELRSVMEFWEDDEIAPLEDAIQCLSDLPEVPPKGADHEVR